MEPNRETPQPNVTAPHEQPAMLRITLSSISDAVITTDIKGLVTFLNPVAQALTGWTQADALGIPLENFQNREETATESKILRPVRCVM
jgi:PAS domain S-box-containing protein